ncbi:DNA polymerase I [Leptotrichia sp. oral taxon 212]|uniref:DNA polymerase I n=1 Tax=Leptotrichia sp. oral taxon 212 TaxID=712357 RepID=UPI0006A987AC|nr:DNA polymerase I [Leptotrichia sp. oral taxon 212]ALA95750.1 DNA polymerase I [Leptotrichia sp. oral taxon 212]
MKKAVILDTSAIMYRTHFALMGMRNSKGLATGATYGFVNTLEGVLKEFSPDYLVACLDIKRSELKRSEELETYKAHRESMPEDLVVQQEYIMSVLEGYKIPKYKIDGYEADDVMATLATKFSEDTEEEIEVYVVTGDKDLAQLVNGKINIALLGKGDKKSSLFKYIRTDEDVIEYLGVTPDKIPDLFGLMGDSSDGIPGVSGIGPKTGVELIKKYGNLEGLYEHIDEIKGKRKEKLIENKENAFLSRKLATVYRDIEIEYDKNKLKLENKDLNKLLEVYRAMEFKKFAAAIENQLKKSADSSVSSQKNDTEENSLFGGVANHPHRNSESANSEEILKENLTEITGEVIEWNEAAKVLSEMDNEIALFGNEFGLAVCDSSKNIVLLNDEKATGNTVEEIYRILSLKIITAYNVKEYIKIGINCEKYFDVMLAWYVLGTESSQDLENIIFSELGVNLEKFEEQFKKRKIVEVDNKEKAEFLWKRAFYIKGLEVILEDRLRTEDLHDIFENLENKLVPVLASMENFGIKIDKKYFENYKKELQENIEKLEKEIYSLSGETFNIGSPKQLGEILFEKMGIEPVKKTKTGYSTDVEVLEVLALRGIEIAEKLLEYRGFTKLLSTYVEPLPKLADEDDRIHTTFNQNGTSTGRLSSANPNIQNIPVRTDEGIKIRKGFISQDGWSLVSFDYSQIELRVLAELSKDENLLLAYKKDKDLHDLTARKIFFKTDEEQVTREQRSIAKVINFSILYGKTPFGLSKELKIPVADASQYIKTYFEQYPKVKKFLENVLENARQNGFVETLYGTRRYINNINSSNKNLQAQANRMAVNTVVQGTAANIIKKVMIKLYDEFKNNDDIKMLLQVHDELIFEVKDEVSEKYMEKIKEIMEGTIKFEDIKLSANGSLAKNWGLLK